MTLLLDQAIERDDFVTVAIRPRLCQTCLITALGTHSSHLWQKASDSNSKIQNRAKFLSALVQFLNK